MNSEERVSALLKARDYTAAATAIEDRLRLDLTDEQAWLQLIECYERAGDIKLGKTISAAAEALPNSERVAVARARWLSTIGREAEAIDILPRNAPASMRLRLLERLGRDDDAIACALDCNRIGFDAEVFSFALDRLIGAGRVAEAEHICSTAPAQAWATHANRSKLHALSLARAEPSAPRIVDDGLAALAILVDRANLTVLDVGGRGGDLGALATFAPFLNYVTCEPNEAAHAKLGAAARARAPWRSVHVSAYALGRTNGPANFFVTAKGGLSSLYQPDAEMFANVGMADRARVERVIPVDLRRLDSLVAENEFPPPDILKLDVQGAELDVLEGAGAALTSVGAILLEMEYRPFYQGQPLFADLDSVLRQKGFDLIDFDVSRLTDIDRGLANARPRPVWSHALYVTNPDGAASKPRRALAATATLAAFHQFALARVMLQRACADTTRPLTGLDRLREHAAATMTAKEIAAAKLFALPVLTAFWPPAPETPT
jgi:FkbM family methyltransferase